MLRRRLLPRPLIAGLSLLLAALPAVSARPARADEPATPSVLPRPPAAEAIGPGSEAARRWYDSGLRIRTAGQVLAISGGVLLVTGVILIGAGAASQRTSQDSNGALSFTGLGLLPAGALVGLPAAVLWPLGQQRMNEARTTGAPPEGTSGADAVGSGSAAGTPPPYSPERLLKSGQTIRRAGIAVTICGAAMMVAGALTAAITKDHCCPSLNDTIAIGVGGAGLLTTITGLSVWGYGAYRIREAGRLSGGRLTLAPAPPGSLGLGLRWEL